MDDLNRLYQLVAAREAGDLSDHGAEVLGQLAVRMPEEYEAATRPRVRVLARFNETTQSFEALK